MNLSLLLSFCNIFKYTIVLRKGLKDCRRKGERREEGEGIVNIFVNERMNGEEAVIC